MLGEVVLGELARLGFKAREALQAGGLPDEDPGLSETGSQDTASYRLPNSAIANQLFTGSVRTFEYAFPGEGAGSQQAARLAQP